MESAEVIVVGAGLSGLSAAYELQKAGISYIVLEARDRVGGKTWSIDPLESGKVVDVGAAWINDTNQSEVYALAKDLGLELVVQNTTGRVIQEDISGELSTFQYGEPPEKLSEPDAVIDMLRIRALFEEECQKIDIRDISKNNSGLDCMNLQQWVESQSKSQTALASTSVWTRAMLGLEPSEVSALYFLNYCKSGGGLLQMRKDTRDGGQYLRFVKGTQSLSLGLCSRLARNAVRLSSPVTSITQSTSISKGKNVITVKTSETSQHIRNYICCRLILTLPTPLYSTIVFSPALPPQKLIISQNTNQGYTNKLMIFYRTPWWRRAGLCGLIQSFVGPITVTRDSSVESTAQYSLTCFLVGAFGRQLSALSKRERIDKCIEHVHRLFSPFCAQVGVEIEQPLTTVEHEWSKDEWSRGCPVPCVPPGLMTDVEPALRSVWDGIHFAGTETSYEWKGYMDGAIRSGKRAAAEVADALRPAESASSAQRLRDMGYF